MSLDMLAAISAVRSETHDAMRVLEAYLPRNVMAEIEVPYLQMQERINEVELVILTNMRASAERKAREQ